MAGRWQTKGLPPPKRSVLFIFLGVWVLYHVWGESARVYGYDPGASVLALMSSQSPVLAHFRLRKRATIWLQSVYRKRVSLKPMLLGYDHNVMECEESLSAGCNREVPGKLQGLFLLWSHTRQPDVASGKPVGSEQKQSRPEIRTALLSNAKRLPAHNLLI